jgi:hypothetical protein
MKNQENNIISEVEKKTFEKVVTNQSEKLISLEMRLIGWTGSILIISAYATNSLGYLDSQNILYPILNLAGSFFMGIRI